MSAAPAKVPEWVDTARLCFEVCISEATVDAWVRHGILPPPVYRGGKRLWRWRDVDTHLAGTTPTGAPSPHEQVENIRDAARKALEARRKDSARNVRGGPSRLSVVTEVQGSGPEHATAMGSRVRDSGGT